jgi:hypothetical protein
VNSKIKSILFDLKVVRVSIGKGLHPTTCSR